MQIFYFPPNHLELGGPAAMRLVTADGQHAIEFAIEEGANDLDVLTELTFAAQALRRSITTSGECKTSPWITAKEAMSVFPDAVAKLTNRNGAAPDTIQLGTVVLGRIAERLGKRQPNGQEHSENSILVLMLKDPDARRLPGGSWELKVRL